jgi:hypothetical protein
MAPSEMSLREAAPSTSNDSEDMTVSTPKKKYTEREASVSSTSSAASLSAVSFEEVSPLPEMERSSSKRKYKYRFLRASRVNNTSQKAGKSVTRKQLPVDGNKSDGSVAGRENDNDYCKQRGGFNYGRSHK